MQWHGQIVKTISIAPLCVVKWLQCDEWRRHGTMALLSRQFGIILDDHVGNETLELG